MVIFQYGPEETRERSLQGAQDRNATSEYPGGSHSRVYDDWHGNFRQRGRSSNPSRALQSTGRTNSTARGSELVLTDEHHSGLEGYGRLVGSSGEPSSHSHFPTAMGSSHFTTGSNNSYNQLDSGSYFNVDSSLENYGKYLGSSLEPGYSGDSNRAESLRNQQDASRSSGYELNGGSLSDFAGLGSYSQTSFESCNFGLSTKQNMEDVEFTDYGGYGGGLF
ncbi:protein rtoA-like [Macrobrachium rosenbergii]|uniref:protein rtoA-like n=1 Tax=Macrobrachium rosenbergii TaxID=79674 RepID=UPI0034D59424